MKVTVEVNLSDIWPSMQYDDELGSSPEMTLGREVEAAIANEVKVKIWGMVREQTTKAVETAVYEHVQKTVSSKVDAYIEQYLEKGTISSGGADYTVASFVERFITDNKIWSSVSANLSKVAENYAKDVQKKYDVLFATHIVMCLKDTGMLDKDKIALLFDGNK